MERDGDGEAAADPQRIERIVRARLRGLRIGLGLSLGDVAARAHLSASTLSRIETGKRSIGLDVLLLLARALGVDLDTLLDPGGGDGDVVIRPVAHEAGGHTTWMLNRTEGGTVALKVRVEPTAEPPEQKVHPGHDWFFVLEGRVCLLLGDRRIVVEAGEAAEFATMTPHALVAQDGPAEFIMIFDRDGHRAHLHRGSG